MRRYLLVLVTIAVVLSLALVGCVGAPAGGGDQGGTTPQPTPTTPTFTPKPTESKILLGTKVKFDWSGWTAPSGFIPQGYNFYYVAGATGTDCCNKEPKWGDPISINICCPATEVTVNQCGCFWWKVEACGIKDGQPATVTVVSARSFCVVPGFVVSVTTPDGTPIKSVTVQLGKEELDLKIDVCKLTDPASIVISATPTLCATTALKVEITKPATPFFDLGLGAATGTTFSATLTSTSQSATVTLDASDIVCSSMFGQAIATVTLTVFPDVVEQCATVTHCCKTVYKVNIILEGEEPELLLWAACGPCGVACDCGWLVLKVPACLSPDTDATLTVEDPIKIFGSSTASIPWYEVYSFEWVYGDPDVDDYVYFARCLTDVDTETIEDGVKSYPGAQAIEAGKTYYIDMKKGTFQLENGEGVAFGWPCADWKKKTITATAGQE